MKKSGNKQLSTHWPFRAVVFQHVTLRFYGSPCHDVASTPRCPGEDSNNLLIPCLFPGPLYLVDQKVDLQPMGGVMQRDY